MKKGDDRPILWLGQKFHGMMMGEQKIQQNFAQQCSLQKMSQRKNLCGETYQGVSWIVHQESGEEVSWLR